MQPDQLIISSEASSQQIFGVEEMLDAVETLPLHSSVKKGIQDYGELCDSDCQDCD